MTTPRQPATGNRQRLRDDDRLLIAICVAVVLASVAIVVRYFDSAFPQVALEFRFDRKSSRAIAEKVLAAQGLDTAGMKHAVQFDSDDTARIFLERSLGLAEANRVAAEEIRIYTWHHRWFRPLVEEEFSVDVAPTGEIIGFAHRIPEDRAAPPPDSRPPAQFLSSIGVNVADLNLVEQSERKLPHRTQRIYTWESSSIRPAGAQYRHTLTIDGNIVTSYAQHLRVPDAWERSYRELRSKNMAAGQVDLIFLVATMVAAVVVFIIRLRRGDLSLRFLLSIAVASIVLVGATALNSLPAQIAHYDTTTSYPAFLGQIVFQTALSSVGTAMILIVICGAGEVLYRQRLPGQLAIPRLWTRRALASRRVFLGLVIGYTLVPLFIAYQVVFYLTAHRFGAWAPAEVPYDEMMNSAFPWVAVLFAGFFPAFSEEFLSRAFSIPLIQRLVRSRAAAIVLAGFIWGFGHATYPNQPFWIRGVEVGLVGVVAGLLMDRFGLLPLLTWHYTIDAVYTATLLFASGNTYYIVSAAVASLLFLIPLVLSVALYVRNKGFLPDDELTNAAMPAAEPEAHPEVAVAAAEFPAAAPVTRNRVLACIALAVVAAAAVAFRPPSPGDASDYRMTAKQAKDVAREHVRSAAPTSRFAYVIALPVEGFRSWNPDSPREDGGVPGEFDEIAATWLVRHGVSVERLIGIFRTKIEAGTWMVRFFTPMQKEEIFVEVDPRTGKVLGYHRYQDEQKASASLSREATLAAANAAFATYGLNAADFQLKEALSFQQPQRRDWLFHFEERTPLVTGASRRATVRVAGSEVTQFNKTIKLPESVYREATTQTLINVVLFVVKIVGVVALLALIIAGLVMATRAHGLPWRRALRWTMILAVIPVAAFAARSETLLFGYSTTISWETFRVGLITGFVREVGLQIGVMFLALAGLEATVPYSLSLATREGRARFGRGAAVAAVMAVSVAAIATVLLHAAAHAFPWAASVTFSAPMSVAMPLPALVEAAQALFGAIVLAAAVSLFTTAARHRAAIVGVAALFCASVDPAAMPNEVPLMLARSAVVAILVWVIARFILGANPLAWPLAAFVGSTLQAAGTLLHNHRPDLVANGVALVAFAAVAILWAVARRPDARVV